MFVYLEQIKQLKVTSSLLKEYISFKEQNPDAIVLFQIGDFFETFFEDAKIFSEITGTTLGTRNIKDTGAIAQAGVNKSNINLYIKKLLMEGCKICICEQFKNEADNSYYRKVTRTFTKGTILEQEFLEGFENNYILAVYNHKDDYFISFADVSTGQFYKTKGSFNEAVVEINKINPDELLIAKSQVKMFENIISKYNTTLLDDEYFDYKKIQNTIDKYCSETQMSFKSKLDKVIEYKLNSYLILDEITRRNLELTRTKRFLRKKGSIIWFLNYTKTPMGARLLKKYVDEPLLDIAKIKERQNAVKELIENKNCLISLESTLEEFCDLSRLCAKISNATIYPKDLYKISADSDNLKNIYNLTKALNSELLSLNEKKLEDTVKLASTIKEALKENLPNELKNGNIINDGYNYELDCLREKLKDIDEKISKYEQKERKRLGIENLKISYSGIIGCFIEIPSVKQNSIPSDYIKKQSLSNCKRYTTDVLKNFEEEKYNLQFRINQMEYELFCEIRKMAVEFIDDIRYLAKDIARIDVLCSFARSAIINNLTPPDFNNKGIYIEDGFHPSLIKLKNEVIKNDTNLDNASMIVLTGANMSGKSTYLKHNAIICLLSQIGSYIPAKKASLPITDKIFLRQGSSDDIINNNSSFMVEMNDLKYIIDNATNYSFVLLDEPAKSTSAKEGGAIGRAFCEYLLKHSRPKTLIATHNLELTKLEQSYPKQVYNYSIGSNDSNSCSIIDRKIKRGIVKTSHAISTAALAGLPDEIITSAKEYMAI